MIAFKLLVLNYDSGSFYLFRGLQFHHTREGRSLKKIQEDS